MEIQLEMLPQPTASSCGPTCLHAIYRYFGLEYDLNTLIREIPENEDGGTLSVNLALHALRHGFRATTYSYNLRIFDPTWRHLGQQEMRSKLDQRRKRIGNEKLAAAHSLYMEFVERGGLLKFNDLTPALLRRLHEHGMPVLTGLSATYLYQTMRERPDNTEDDISGFPSGHFVVLRGFDSGSDEVFINDPYRENPFNPNGDYRVGVHRLINSVMLGIVTYDANLLIITPSRD